MLHGWQSKNKALFSFLHFLMAVTGRKIKCAWSLVTLPPHISLEQKPINNKNKENIKHQIAISLGTYFT
jgi:hypothetical protein